MDCTDVIKELGYADSYGFLSAKSDKLKTAPGFGHIFRRAQDTLGLKGVYTLRNPRASAGTPVVPVVYVCEAESDEKANEIHKLVWNQDVAPFVLVTTPKSIRLYSGFSNGHSRGSAADSARGLLNTFNAISEIIDLRAESIDTGAVWRSNWAKLVRPDERVDRKLLANLSELSQWLQRHGGLRPDVAHALIGKYVYLHYLRDRGILSDRKLEKWSIPRATIFGRDATQRGFRRVTDKLDEWLNGRVFPVEDRDVITDLHLGRVAATFAGDQPHGDGRWQQHLDFQAYDFSYIPIETLSVVYEQFLHEPREGGRSKGRDASAYYTPIPVVNFMLAEMDDRRPLQRGMRVLDPSCGSGAFLVQCYRRLIERIFPATGKPPRPVELRGILTEHIFGVDRDADACSVTEMSLVLTLLDYVDPPDLEDSRNFKLPSLRDKNIFCADFFDSTIQNGDGLPGTFHWIVGNPPWRKLPTAGFLPGDRPSHNWLGKHIESHPTGGRQVAEAFAWRVLDYAEPKGMIALLLPAMVLFESHSRRFREAFFHRAKVASIANFSNLRFFLFRGRAISPAAAFFYSPGEPTRKPDSDEYVSAYSPMLANQEPIWALDRQYKAIPQGLLLNASEIRAVRMGNIASGQGLAWKIAAWGSHLDQLLLERLARRFPLLSVLKTKKLITVAQGAELRSQPVDRGVERTAYCPQVADKFVLEDNALEEKRPLFFFPGDALNPNQKHHLRIRGGEAGLTINEPPHIVVNAARSFAVYTDQYLIVSPRQIGITSPEGDCTFLKALSLYLSSDFVYYHQFLTSSEFGVERGVATLKALKQLPVPILSLGGAALDRWEHLHTRLVRANQWSLQREGHGDLFSMSRGDEKLDDLIGEMNQLVNGALQLTAREQALVHDLVHVRLALVDGALGGAATCAPPEEQLQRYASRLKTELDTFVGGVLHKLHQISILYEPASAVVCIDLVEGGARAGEIRVLRADDETGSELAKARQRLRKKWAQWVYFDRNLMIFEGTRTYLFKPMQRFHWTESQAMLDAGEIISRTLASGGETV